MVGYGHFFWNESFFGFYGMDYHHSTTQKAKYAQNYLPTLKWKWGKEINVETRKIRFLWNGTGRILRGPQSNILRYLKEKILLKFEHVIQFLWNGSQWPDINFLWNWSQWQDDHQCFMEWKAMCLIHQSSSNLSVCLSNLPSFTLWYSYSGPHKTIRN